MFKYASYHTTAFLPFPVPDAVVAGVISSNEDKGADKAEKTPLRARCEAERNPSNYLDSIKETGGCENNTRSLFR